MLDTDESLEMFKRFQMKINAKELEDIGDFQSSLKVLYVIFILYPDINDTFL